MKGDGENRGFRDFLSLGSGSGGSGSEGYSGRAGGGDESSSSSALWLLQSPNPLHMSLSRNGLSMLAGGANGSFFSLKPPAVGHLATGLRGGNSAVRVSKVSGGGFTGFYRATSANKSSTTNNNNNINNINSINSINNINNNINIVTTRSKTSLPELKLRFGNDETGEAIASKVGEQPLKTDVENLTPDECWRLILKLGSRWPAWNHSTTASQPPPQGVVVKDRSATKEESVPDLQLGQDSLKYLSSRALEALAQTPDQHGRPAAAGGMLSPKWTTQEVAKTKTPTPSTPPTPSKPTQAVSVTQQSSLVAELPVCPSPETTAPKVTSSESRTAPLTIFYAGTVNVCDNVPEDKARLIMLFAEKAGVPPSNAQEPSSAQATPLSKPVLERVQPQEELQLSKPSSEVVLATSCVPPHLETSAKDAEEGSTLDQQTPSESLAPSEMVPLTITFPEGKSRQRRQQGAAKPLPNARKNSLARFLDTRKRNRPTASSCSDGHGQPTTKKRPALSDSFSSDANDVKGRHWHSPPARLGSQSSVNSREGIATCAAFNDADMHRD